MYLDALVEELTQRGHRRWFVLYPATEAGRALYRSALEAIRKAGAIAVAHAEIPIEQRIYDRAIRVALQVKADIILSLLSPENQDFFLAQMKTMGVELAVASFSDPVAQTRSYWLRMRQAAFRAESSYRVDLWEANLWEGHAGELNDQFGSRTGVPMDPTAWATFAAVKVVVDSVLATGSADPERIAEYMASSGSRFDLYKGVPLSFRPWDHQLRQPLYLVQVNPEAEVGTRLYQQQALVRLLAQVPAIPEGVDPVVFLDRYGDTTVQHPCR
jgi:ABC-type branched-subunit amino acid transport system substrate-binding protein